MTRASWCVRVTRLGFLATGFGTEHIFRTVSSLPVWTCCDRFAVNSVFFSRDLVLLCAMMYGCSSAVTVCRTPCRSRPLWLLPLPERALERRAERTVTAGLQTRRETQQQKVRTSFDWVWLFFTLPYVAAFPAARPTLYVYVYV